MRSTRRGRPVPGLYVRDGRFTAGFRIDGRSTMRTLDADTLTQARRERESLLAGLREGRIAAPAAATFAALFAEYQAARNRSERTGERERAVVDRYLADLKPRRVQDVTASDLARRLRHRRDTGKSEWTPVGVYRVLHGTFALALRRGIVTRNPVNGLAPSERPKQRNKRQVAVLDPEAMGRLVAAGTTERWQAALGLAGYAGLRLGELRALTWADVDLDANTLTVRRALTRDGTPKAPKTEAGAQNRADAAGAAEAARRLAAARRRRKHGRRPRHNGGATVQARAPALVRVDACHRPRAASDDARRACRTRKTPASRSTGTPATAATKRRSFKTCSPERQARKSARERRQG